MFLLDDLLLAPLKGIIWLWEKVKEVADRELYDVEAIKKALEELQELHEAGQLKKEEFAQAEETLLRRLQVAQERKRAGAEG